MQAMTTLQPTHTAPAVVSAAAPAARPPARPADQPPEMALIAAVASNGAIGRAAGLLWFEPADQRHFRDTTLGHAVLMGRKTWESLPARFRPLPGRRNLVLTRQPGLPLQGAQGAPGAEVYSSLAQALAALQGVAKLYVIGGGEIYAQALPLACELVLTEIDAALEGDVFFPPWDRSAWREVERRSATTAAGGAYHFVKYRRPA